jgi:hypothetical protein
LRAHLLVDPIRTALVSRSAGFRVDEEQLDAWSRRRRRLYAPSRAGSSCRTKSAPVAFAATAHVLRTPDDGGTGRLWVARSLHKFRLFCGLRVGYASIAQAKTQVCDLDRSSHSEPDVTMQPDLCQKSCRCWTSWPARASRTRETTRVRGRRAPRASSPSGLSIVWSSRRGARRMRTAVRFGRGSTEPGSAQNADDGGPR